MNNQLRARSFFISRHDSKQSSKVEPFCRLSMSTLDNFLQSDQNFVQLPRLLSQFQSIDHEKNISSCNAQVVALWGTFENCPVSGGTLDPRHLILIWDMGVSFDLTPFWGDFIYYVVECDFPVRNVNKVNRYHKDWDYNSQIYWHWWKTCVPPLHFIPPSTDRRPSYHQMHGGYLEVYNQSIQMRLCTSTISIDIVRDLTNLPVVHDSYVSDKAKCGIGPLMWSGHKLRLSALDFFGEIDLVISSIVTQSDQFFFLVSRVSVIQKTKICHSLRGSYFCGIGNLVSICIGSKNSCVSQWLRNL